MSVSPPSRSPFSHNRSRVIPPVPPVPGSLISNEGEVHDALPPSATASKTSIPLSRRESAGWDMNLLHTVNRIGRLSNPSDYVFMTATYSERLTRTPALTGSANPSFRAALFLSLRSFHCHRFALFIVIASLFPPRRSLLRLSLSSFWRETRRLGRRRR